MKLYKKRISLKRKVKGVGLINSVINNLPFEVHIPGYNFCGPGTKLKKRIERGDQGINLLDSACREHDIAYSKYPDFEGRHQADLILQEKADERAKASDANLGEKVSAVLVRETMKAKRKIGAGKKKRGKGTKKGGYLLPMMTTALAAFKTYKDWTNARKALELQQKHNENMEKIAKGKGLYMRPYKGGGKKKKRRNVFYKWSHHQRTTRKNG